MLPEPHQKQAVAFFDGQNLFYAAREAFGYNYPNYDPKALAEAVCNKHGWSLIETRFYTGVPDARDNASWNHFWTAKLAQMGRAGIVTYSRPLRYRNQTVHMSDGSERTVLVGQEKGIDIRIAIDVVRLAHQRKYDVAIIFSQDQDLSEVANEIRAISCEQDRWIKVVSPFPSSPTSKNNRGINKTDWIPIDRAVYDSCLDPRSYRPKR
jgi:uncharacterized LabA/DUF88 family protein